MCKWLDKRVIGFRQTVREFLTSKTNQVSISAIVGAGIAYANGRMDAVQAANLIVPALIGLALKDSHAAAKEGA